MIITDRRFSEFTSALHEGMPHLEHMFVDFDGVIIDSEPIQARCYSTVLLRYGVNFTADEFAGLMGNSESKIWSVLIDRYNLSRNADELTDERRDLLIKSLTSNDVRSNWYMKPLLKFAVDNDVVPQIVSANQTIVIEAVLKHVELADAFGVIHSLQEIRPSISKSVLLAQLVGDSSSSSLIIEDSASTLRAAKQQGLFCVAVRHSLNDHSQVRGDIVLNAF